MIISELNLQSLMYKRLLKLLRYVPCGVLRLTKAQLDGACSDDRFDEDFFIDLIFAPVEKMNFKTSMGGGGGGASSVPSDSGLVIDVSSSDMYEQSLHRDTRFWDAVSARKIKSKKRRSRKYLSNTNDQFSITDEGSASTHDDDMDSIRFSAVTGDRSSAALSSSSGEESSNSLPKNLPILYLRIFQFFT